MEKLTEFSTPNQRQCLTCKELKPLTEYHRGGPGGYHGECKVCRCKRETERWHARSPEEKRAIGQRLKLQGHGLEDWSYEALVEIADGCCMACERPTGVLVIDHDHTSGQVRGLLCRLCNGILGLVADNEQRLVQLADYLRVPPAGLIIGEALASESRKQRTSHLDQLFP